MQSTVMARHSSPTFVTEIPLKVSSQQEKELLSRFQGGRQLYNSCLSEAMVRMKLLRKSSDYKQAKSISKEEKKKRNQAFSNARRLYLYSDYDLQAYATLVANKSKWIKEKLDSNTQQTLATRAFEASERVLFGKAKKVRFKVVTRFRSMQGKTNKQGIRWKDNSLLWGKLRLEGIIDHKNPVINHGLNSRVKYVRVLWRELNGKRRWFAQLSCEGEAYQKPKNYVSSGTVGLDLNISNIAFVADDYAGLLPFAKDVPSYDKEICALQRKMERSRRTNNPDNYEPDKEGRKGRKTVVKKGKPKKGRRKWNNSKRYQKIASKKRNIERKKSAYSKSRNRQLVNDVLRHGKHIKIEKVSVKGWQKRYGKAILSKSPGFVQSELIRKAENAGGSVVKFSCQSTALSQTHLDGTRIKKSLSERVHRDQTGIVMHRDLFSAYLARYVDEDKLSLQDASNQYPGMEATLLEAWERFNQQSASYVGRSPPN